MLIKNLFSYSNKMLYTRYGDEIFIDTSGNVGLGKNNSEPSYPLDVSGSIYSSGQYISDTSLSPLIVTSSQLVNNLNVQYLNNQQSNYYLNVSNINSGVLNVGYGGIGTTILGQNNLLIGNSSSNVLSASGLIWNNNKLDISGNLSVSKSALFGDISASNINFTGNLYQNGILFEGGSGGSGGQWEDGSNNKIYYNLANVGIGTSNPTKTLDISGDLIVNNFTVRDSWFIAEDTYSIRNQLQLQPILKLYYLSESQSIFNDISLNGYYDVLPNNVGLYLNGTKLLYYDNSNKEYDVIVNHIDISNTIITITLYTPTQSGDILDVTIFPTFPNDVSTRYPGYVYQVFNQVFNNVSGIGTSYTYANVGIGTNIPTQNLDVSGNALIRETLYATNVDFSGNLYQNGQLYISSQWTTDNSNNTLYYNDGNVGIGTNYATNTLDVSGSALIRGHILPGSNISYDLGSSTNRWRDIYLSGNTIDISGALIKRDASGIILVNEDNSTLNAHFNDITLDGNIAVGGNFSVLGTLTTIDSTVVTVQDPIITLGLSLGVLNSNDGKDRGIEFLYYNGSSKKGFFGFDNLSSNFVYLLDASNNNEVFTGTYGGIQAGSFISSNTSGAPFTVSSSGLITNLNTDLLDSQDGTYYLNWNNFSNIPNLVNTFNNRTGNVTLTATDISEALTYIPLDETTYNASDILAKLITVDGSGSQLDADFLDGENGMYYRNMDNVNNGTLKIEYGGTGNTSLTSGKLLVGDGTNAILTPVNLTWNGSNLGIGSLSPSQTLDVSGNIVASGNISAGNFVSCANINFSGDLYKNGQLYVSSQWTTDNSNNNLYYNLGNVGIGTNDPSQQLDISGTMIVDNFIVRDEWFIANDTPYTRTQLQIQGTSKTFILVSDTTIFDISMNGRYRLDKPQDIHIYIDGVKLGYYDSSNNDYTVYVNTQTTYTIFTITLNEIANSGSIIDITVYPRFLTDDAIKEPGYVYQVFNSPWDISNNNAYYFGNVGIGSSEPSQALDVSGNISAFNALFSGTVNATNIDFSGDLYKNGQLYVSSQWIDGSSNNLYYNIGNIGIGTSEPSQQLDISGTMIVDNIIVRDEWFIANDTPYTRTQLQVQGITKTFNITSNNTTIFDISMNGRFKLDKSNDVHVYVDGIKLGYLSSISNDYEVVTGLYSTYTNFTITLNIGVNIGNVVDIVVYPRFLSEDAIKEPGYVYQVFNSPWDISNNNAYYNSGNVGIGSISPSQALDVSGNIAVSGNISAGNFVSCANINFSGNLYKEGQLYISSQWTNGSNNSLYYNIGNVGIGVTNPQAPLHLVGTPTLTARFSPIAGSQGSVSTLQLWSTFQNTPADNAARYSSRITSGFNGGAWGKEYLVIGVGNNGVSNDALLDPIERVRIDGNGNVGIGVTGPTEKLEVSGNVKATTFIGALTGNASTATQLFTSRTIFGQSFNGTANVTGDITPNGKIVVQNAQDGGTSRGIYMWQASDSNWGIYMSQPGATKSLGGATAVAGHDFGSYAIRSRAYNNNTNGFIWENSSEVLLMSLNANTGNLFMTGNVGIGVINPGVPLQVKASSSTVPSSNGIYLYNPTNSANQNAIMSIRTAGASAGNPYISFDIANVTGWAIGQDRADASKFKISNAWDSLTSATKVTIDTGGNVGIGVSNPQAKLDVSGTIFIKDGTVTNPILAFSGDTNTGFYRPGSDILGFVTGGIERLRINANGNLGIGSTLPFKALDVSGGINFTDNLYKNGQLYVSSQWKNTLDISGQAIDGSNNNLYYNTGNVGIGTNNPQAKLDVSGNTLIRGHVLPGTNISYDLGSSSQRWRDIYLSGSTIDISGALIKRDASGIILVNINDNTLDARFNNIRLDGNIAVGRNLSVLGTLTTINSTVVTVQDPIITLGLDTPTSNDGKDRGIEFLYYNGSVKQGFFGFDNTSSNFVYLLDATNTNEILSGTYGGIQAGSFISSNTSGAPFTVSSSGLVTNLNTDLLDSQDGTYYLNWNNFSNIPNLVNTFNNRTGNVTLTATDISEALTYVPLNQATYNASDILAKLITVDGSGSQLNADFLDGQNGLYYRNMDNVNNGTLKVEYGGTGNISLTSGKLLVGNGTNAILTPTNLTWNGSNLGIGSLSPSRQLDVSGGINFTDNLYKNGQLYISSQWVDGSDNSLYYNTGNIGIGSNNPSYQLDVSGGINFTDNLYKNGQLYISSQWVDGSDNSLYYNTGNIGIGTNFPTADLDISGDLLVRGNFVDINGNAKLFSISNYQSWSPEIISSISNPIYSVNISNFRYNRTGYILSAEFVIDITLTSIGNGIYKITLPQILVNNVASTLIGSGIYTVNDYSYQVSYYVDNGTNLMEMRLIDGAVTHNHPYTNGVGTVIKFAGSISYECGTVDIALPSYNYPMIMDSSGNVYMNGYMRYLSTQTIDWIPYLPIVTSTVNPSLDGEILGKYVQLGKTLTYQGVIDPSNNGLNTGSGIYYFSLPLTGAVLGLQDTIIGTAQILDKSSNVSFTMNCVLLNSTPNVFYMVGTGVDNGVFSNTYPLNPITSSIKITWNITYETELAPYDVLQTHKQFLYLDNSENVVIDGDIYDTNGQLKLLSTNIPYISHTPIIKASITDPTVIISNGNQYNMRYNRVGNTIIATFTLQYTHTTTGSGIYQFTLPQLPLLDEVSEQLIGTGMMIITTTNTSKFNVNYILSDSGNVTVVIPDTVANFTNTHPYTIGAGTVIKLYGMITYETLQINIALPEGTNYALSMDVSGNLFYGNEMKYLSGNNLIWKNYEPYVSANISPVFGSGNVVTGRYTQIGKTVTYQGYVNAGSVGLNPGSGTYYITLPVPAYQFINNDSSIGTAYITDTETDTTYSMTCILLGNDNNRFYITGGSVNNGRLGANFPKSPFNSYMRFSWFITYEATVVPYEVPVNNPLSQEIYTDNNGNIGIGTNILNDKFVVDGNVQLGKGIFGSGNFYKQITWDISGSSHIISYPYYCIGQNSSGTLMIQVSNNSIITPKIGNMMVSFIKVYGEDVDIFVISSHNNDNLNVLTITGSGNNIVVNTDADCSIAWSTIGAI